MCMHTKLPRREKDKWLKDKPETLILYKAVRIRKAYVPFERGVYYPLFMFDEDKYELRENNKLPTRKKRFVMTSVVAGRDRVPFEKFTYIPYYHFFTSLSDASIWHSLTFERVLIKCKVPRSSITSVGGQYYTVGNEKYIFDVVVAKEFEVIEEVEPACV